jgi:hypothetical protein
LRGNLAALETVKSSNIDLRKDEDGTLAVDVRLREAPADLSVLRGFGPLGLASGIAALGGWRWCRSRVLRARPAGDCGRSSGPAPPAS